ncbi:integrase core domain-containing protein [Actinoallomurus sp. NPDC050550]|uniref:integrase core domain-containing protein n=1 Tax=Actinoallomurus sp. NPDC050550 TaxID=3154937 RepID=UPI00340BD2EB
MVPKSPRRSPMHARRPRARGDGATKVVFTAGSEESAPRLRGGEVFKSEGLRIITTLPKTPRMNAICERVIGTLRRELLDRTLILGERHLALVLREYLIHYNRHRPHQSRQQRPRTSKRSPSGTWPTRDPRPPKTRCRGSDQRISPRRLTPAQTT